MTDVVPCPRKTCQNPVLVSERTVNLGTCQVCGLSFCVLCFRAYHGVDGCNFKTIDKQRILKEWNSAGEQERVLMARRFGGLKNLQRIIDTLLNEGWIDGNSKPCPRCRVNIEKNEGCNKMHCTKCDVMFCWLCNRILDKNNPYSHFNEEGGGCANRLFEGITAADSDDEDGDVNWMDFIDEGDSESDSDVEIVFEDREDSDDSD
ncbi:IBR domain protein [Oesophagostomum dentatum]|uniref:RBR-type E3 ubiquitin transferase n=1 Tax=Oesophagostomum dentatum TaxID=61180 RepID=A0A0B1TSA1_OESDE|nr:IBR domain protein [Oesophagostomum dentatum]